MYVPNRSSSAYQLDAYVEKLPDKKAEKAKNQQMKIRAKRRKLALYMMIFFVTLFAMLFRYVRISDLHNDIAKQTSQLEALQTDNERTRLNIESLTDKTKIQDYAETQLGLKKITSAQIVYLNPVRQNYMKNVGKSDSNGTVVGYSAEKSEYLK